MSLCGPRAVARITGQPVREVVAFIYARRRRQGRRPSIRGGTDARELRAALMDAGYHPEWIFWGERYPLAFLATLPFTGLWLFHHERHYVGVRSGAELRRVARTDPDGIIVAGWQILRID